MRPPPQGFGESTDNQQETAISEGGIMTKEKLTKENKKLRSSVKGLKTRLKRLKSVNKTLVPRPEYRDLPGVGYPGSRPRVA